MYKNVVSSWCLLLIILLALSHSIPLIPINWFYLVTEKIRINIKLQEIFEYLEAKIKRIIIIIEMNAKGSASWNYVP